MSPTKTTSSEIRDLELKRKTAIEITERIWLAFIDEEDSRLAAGMSRCHQIAAERVDELDDEIRDLRNGVER